MPRLCLVGLLVFCLVGAVAADDTRRERHGTVTWVYDGDTLEIAPWGTVRLIGIDAPEQKASPRDDYLLRQGVPAARLREIARTARDFNIRHVKGTSVQLTLDATPRDRHGRLLAYVTLVTGKLLNRVLVRQGLAVVYRRFSFRLKDDFLVAEDDARQAEVGLWASESR
jgi:micrococcal nuclease